MRVVFLGSPPFAAPTLRALLESAHRPVAVVTPPDRPQGRGKHGRGRKVEESDVARLAREAGVPLLQPDSARDPAFLAELRAFAPDVCLIASYGEILDDEFLSIPRLGSLNVHGSLLPRHRGASPVQAAILAGDEETGVSIQRVVRALDAGDVLLERRTRIGPEETAGELFGRLAELGAEAAVEALKRLAEGTARFTPQDPERVTVCRKLSKRDGVLDWTRDAAALARLVRAMNPWPVARTAVPGGGLLFVSRAVETGGAGAPGELLEAGTRCVVACGSGALELLEVQPAGKRAMAAADWLRGARLEAGASLGSVEGQP